MEKERRDLVGPTVVKWNRIQPAEFFVKEKVDQYKRQKVNNLIIKYGQYKEIITASINGRLLIVDGQKMYESILQLQINDVRIFNLGELDLFDYYICRMILNSNGQRVDYLGIAQMITAICENEADARKIANATGMNVSEVSRYKDLLKFDWGDYLRKKINPDQMDIFSMLGDSR